MEMSIPRALGILALTWLTGCSPHRATTAGGNRTSATTTPPGLAQAIPKSADEAVVKGVLEGTAYVSPQAAHDIFCYNALYHLFRHDFDELEAQLGAASQQGRWGRGWSADFAFIESLPDSATYLQWETGLGLCLHVEQWMKARPKSNRARLALAKAYLEQCIVLLSGQGEAFREQSDHYWELCEKFAKPVEGELSDEVESFPLTRKLMSGHPFPIAEASQCFTRATKVNPHSSAAYWRIIMYLIIRQRDAIPGFVERVHASAGDAGYALLQAHALCVPDPAPFRPYFNQWESLDKGYRQLLEQEPDSVFLRNAYALAASQGPDPQVARRTLEELGDQWDPFQWKSYRAYARACQKVGVTPNSIHGQVLPHVFPVGGEAKFYKAPSRRSFQFQIRDLVVRHQFAELEEIARRLRALNDPRLSALYGAASGLGVKNRKEYEDRLGALRRWTSTYPDSQTARVALADFYIKFAWLARGGGWSSEVTKAGGQLFSQRIQEASRLLEGPNEDASAYLARLLVLQATTGEPQRAVELARLSLSKHPYEYEIAGKLNEFLMPRWHGRSGDMQRAAEVLVPATRDRLGQGVYTYLSIFGWRQELDRILRDRKHPCFVPWGKVVQGFADLGKARQVDPALVEYYAVAAITVGDRAQARLAFETLGAHWTSEAWRTPECYQAARAWANGQSKVWPYAKPSLKVEKVGWEEGGKFHPGNVLPLRKGITIHVEFTGRLSPSNLLDGIFTLEHPAMRPPGGQPQTVHKRAIQLSGRDPLPVYRYHLEKEYQLQPGAWNLSLGEQDDEPLARVSFTLRK